VEKIDLGWAECSQTLEDLAAAVQNIKPEQKLMVIFANRDFAIDLSAWCHENGFAVLQTGMQDDNYYFVIKRGES